MKPVNLWYIYVACSFNIFFSDMVTQRKSASRKKQNSSKILVRNVPFEASKKELKELFG